MKMGSDSTGLSQEHKLIYIDPERPNILLSIKMLHIQVLIPNENVLIWVHNIWVQKPLGIPPVKLSHQHYTNSIYSRFPTSSIKKHHLQEKFIDKTSIFTVLEKDLIKSIDVNCPLAKDSNCLLLQIPFVSVPLNTLPFLSFKIPSTVWEFR
jgi:hypothetical protein